MSYGFSFSDTYRWDICDDGTGYRPSRSGPASYSNSYPSRSTGAPYNGAAATTSPWRYESGHHTPPRMRPETISNAGYSREVYPSDSRRYPEYRSTADQLGSHPSYDQSSESRIFSSSMYGLLDTFSLKSSASSSAPTKSSKCDRCDGAHDTADCPHFKGDRDTHQDAWSNYSGASKGSTAKLRECAAPRSLPRGVAQVVRMPGDGSCLFHSIAYGLKGLGYHEDGYSIRRCVAHFIESKPDFEITGTPLRSWVDWDSRCNVSNYAQRLSGGALWGGAIEMAACTQIFGVDVAVYEQDYSGGFRRISDFIAEKTPRGVILILYSGRSHYDALVTNEAYAGSQMGDVSARRGEPYYSQRMPPRAPSQDEDEWCSVM